MKILPLLTLATLCALNVHAANDPDKEIMTTAQTAASMVSSIEKQVGATFLKNHNALRQDLVKLEKAAQAIVDSKGKPTAKEKANFQAAVTVAFNRAETISTRSDEKPAEQKKAKDIAVRLKILP